jgi:hypothetical protein
MSGRTEQTSTVFPSEVQLLLPDGKNLMDIKPWEERLVSFGVASNSDKFHMQLAQLINFLCWQTENELIGMNAEQISDGWMDYLENGGEDNEEIRRAFRSRFNSNELVAKRKQLAEVLQLTKHVTGELGIKAALDLMLKKQFGKMDSVIHDDLQWNDSLCVKNAKWIYWLLDPKNQFPQNSLTKYGIFIRSKDFGGGAPKLFYRYGPNGLGDMQWIDGYSGRLVLPNYSDQPKEIKGIIWDCLIEMGIDKEPWLVDYEKKQFMIDWINKIIGQHCPALTSHVEMCGGSGLVAEKLQLIYPNSRHVVADVSPLAMREANQKGFETQVTDLDNECPDNLRVEAGSCLFGFHWLNQRKLDQIFQRWYERVDKVLVGNVYPSSPIQAAYYLRKAQQAGISGAHIEERVFRRQAPSDRWPMENTEYMLVMPKT